MKRALPILAAALAAGIVALVVEPPAGQLRLQSRPRSGLSPRVSLTPSRAPTTATTTQPIPTQPPATTGQTTTGEDDDDDRGRGREEDAAATATAAAVATRAAARTTTGVPAARLERPRRVGGEPRLVAHLRGERRPRAGAGLRGQGVRRRDRFIDTANVTGRGRAEDFLGEALAVRPRDSYILATKPASRCRRRTSVSRARRWRSRSTPRSAV